MISITFTIIIFISSFNLYTQAGLIPHQSQQLIISNSYDHQDQNHSSETSNLILISFASLLQQWPNTFYPNGHSIIPGLIPEGTRLYHGLNHGSPVPTQFEWLAFDPEMSYSIHSRAPHSSQLLTYRASRPLRVIYFDGQSASLDTAGFMDSQTAIIEGLVPSELPIGNQLDHEYLRAEALCKLGSRSGFDGVVRMNTGLELIWCDFQTGIELMTRTNTSTSFGPEDSKAMLNLHKTANWEWARSAIPFYHIGDHRLQLFSSGFISFYDRLPSLSNLRTRRGLEFDRAHHRLDGISSQDSTIVSQRLQSVLKHLNSNDWKPHPHSIDWSIVIGDLIHHYHSRLRNLVHLNLRISSQEAHRITYAILMPYLDTSSHPSHSFSSGLSKCRNGFTQNLFPSVSESDHVLRSAILGVLDRICPIVLNVYWNTLETDDDDLLPPNLRKDLDLLQSDVDELWRWLDWPTVTDCHQTCSSHEICMIPMWPVSRWFPTPSQWPVCAKFEDLNGDKVPPHQYSPYHW